MSFPQLASLWPPFSDSEGGGGEPEPGGGFVGSLIGLSDLWPPFGTGIHPGDGPDPADPEPPIATTFDGILAAFKLRLVNTGLAAPSAIEITLEEEPPPIQSGTRFLVAPLDGSVEDGSSAATGRYGVILRSGIVVHVIDRRVADKLGLDTIRTTGGDGNLLARAFEAIDRLHMKFLADADGRAITVEPIRLAHVSRPLRCHTSPTYARVELDFEVRWQLKLTDDGADPFAAWEAP